MHIKPTAGAFLLALVASACAHAQAWQAALAAGSASYTAEERRADGQLFNRESGRLKLQSAWLKTSHAGVDLQLALTTGQGTLDYVGQTQLFIPLYTQTRLRQDGLQARIDWPLPLPLPAALAPGLQLRLLTGLGTQRQRRTILATGFTSELTETLRTTQVELGVGVDGQLPWGQGRWGWALQLRAQQPLRQRLLVNAGTAFEALELQPARRAGSELWAGLAWQAAPRLTFQLQASSRRWQPGPAQPLTAWRGPLPVGQISYPGSLQQQQNYHAGLQLDI